MMRIIAALVLLTGSPFAAFAGACEDRFAELLVNGNQDQGPVRIHVTQDIVGGMKTTNYHYSDGNNNGMTEMIDPAGLPRALFVGDNMYMSNDSGKTWSFMNSWDAEKGRADMKVALTKDAAAATEIACGEEELDGVAMEVVEGKYISTMSAGAEIHQKYWVDQDSGWIKRTDLHTKSAGFESKSTQVIEPWPDLVLPSPE